MPVVEQEPQRLDWSRIETRLSGKPSKAAPLRLGGSRGRFAFALEETAHAPGDMRGRAGDAEQAFVARLFDPDRATGTGTMLDAVIDAAQRQDNAVRKGRRLRQPVKPRRDPAAMLLGELPRLLETAARRNRQQHLARRGLDAQRVAPRLPMAPYAHQINFALKDDIDG